MNTFNFDTDENKHEALQYYKWLSLDSTDEYPKATHDFLQALISIEEFVTQVLSDDEPAFVQTCWAEERNDLKVFRTKLEKLQLSNYFQYVCELLKYWTPEFRYSANADLFFNCCIKLQLGKEFFKKPNAYTTKRGDLPKQQFELYNELIELIRKESREAEFIGKINHREHNSNRNYASAAEFVTKLFQRRLLVLRVDFSYLPDFANTVTPEAAKADLAHFFFNFRRNKSLSEHLVGYVWKWEFSAFKKMHCHLLFFYDGRKVQDDEFWANRIGTYWKTITDGRGRYYNGNTAQNKAKFEKEGMLGIGMINRIHECPEHDTDKGMRDILINKVLRYLMKGDQYLLSVRIENAKGRLFGKGRGTNWKENVD